MKRVIYIILISFGTFFLYFLCMYQLFNGFNNPSGVEIYLSGMRRLDIFMIGWIFIHMPLWIICLNINKIILSKLTAIFAIKFRNNVNLLIYILKICISDVFMYYLAGETALIFLTYIFQKGPLPDVKRMLYFVIIISIFSISLIIFNILIGLVLKNMVNGFFVVLIYHLFAVIFTDNYPVIGKYLPLVQGVQKLHDQVLITDSFSIVYSLLIMFVEIFLLYIIISVRFEDIIQNKIQ